MAHALQGNKILAQDFNNVVDLYDTFWRDPKDSITGAVITYSFDANHVGPADGRDKGWGQSAVVPIVNSQTVIEAEHMNSLLSQVNAGLYHENNSNLLLTHFATADVIDDTHLNDVENEIAINIAANKLKLGAASGQDTYSVANQYIDVDNNAIQWDNNIHCEVQWCFASYTEARHFFNSGGSLVIDLTSGIGPWSKGKGNSALSVNTNRVTNGQPTNPGAGGGTNGSDDWHEIFRSIGEIHFKAQSCERTGSNGQEGPGFYSLPVSGAYENVFNASGFGPYAYAYSYVYRPNSDPYSSQYGDRAVVVYFKAEEDSITGELCLTGKVVLNEDKDDNYYVDTRIVASCYSIQPIDAPSSTLLATSNGASFTVGSTQYQFLERAAPTVSLTTPWTTSVWYASYALGKSVNQVNEGDSFVIVLTTTNVPSGTLIPYTITGVSSADISGAPLTGNFNVGTIDQITFNVASDTSTEGDETFTISLNNGGSTTNVLIKDTSVGAGTYSLASSSNTVNEGSSFTITLTTANIAQGTTVPYTITGVSSADLGNASLTGNFVVGTIDIITFTASNDFSSGEGNETFIITLDSLNVTTQVTIVDSSIAIYTLRDIFQDTYKFMPQITTTDIDTRLNAIESIRSDLLASGVTAQRYENLVTYFINDNVTQFTNEFNQLTQSQQTASVPGLVQLINNDNDLMNKTGNNQNYGTYKTNYTLDINGLGNWLVDYLTNQTAYDADMLSFSNNLYQLSRANGAILQLIDDINVPISPTMTISSNIWYPN